MSLLYDLTLNLNRAQAQLHNLPDDFTPSVPRSQPLKPSCPPRLRLWAACWSKRQRAGWWNLSRQASPASGGHRGFSAVRSALFLLRR
jgi:hypothetical protein